MSYNGVGLSTPRGSGTNGHIQTNRSHVRANDRFERSEPSSNYSTRAPDAGILDHERRRRVEVKCLELQVSLEDDGVEESEIENQVSTLREKLLAESLNSKGVERNMNSIKSYERHELGQAKELANERLRKAMGISSDHMEGIAFDKEAQARLKIERQAEKQRAAEERAKIQADLIAAKKKATEALAAQREKIELEREERRKEQNAILAADQLEREKERESKRVASLKSLDADLDKTRGERSLSPSSPRRPRRRSTSHKALPPLSSKLRRRTSRSDSVSRSRSRSRSISRSPLPRRARSPTPPLRRRLPSTSPSPPRAARRSRSSERSASRSKSRSRSYSRSTSRSRTRSRSPSRSYDRERRVRRSRSYSRSPSPGRQRPRRYSPSPRRRSSLSPPPRR